MITSKYEIEILATANHYLAVPGQKNFCFAPFSSHQRMTSSPSVFLMTSIVIKIDHNNHDNNDDDNQADTVNPFDTDVSLRPGNLYANLVLAESEQVFYLDFDDDHHHHWLGASS